MYNVGNKDNTYKLINLSWQIRLIKQLIRISLFNSISSIIISVLVRVFSTLSFLLPLKALLIMASQEVPEIVLSYWSSATISSFGSLLIFLSAISFILLLKLEDWKKYYIGLCTDDFKTALQKHSSTVNIVAETGRLLSMIISTIAFGIFSLFLFSILYFVDVNLFFFMMIILGLPITWIILSRRKLFGENLDYTNEFISPQNIKLYSVFAFFSTFVFLAFPLAFSLDFSADKSYHSTLILMISFVISRQLINSGIGYVKGGIDLYHNKINLIENYLYDDLKATSQKSDNKIMPVPPVDMIQKWLQFDELGLVSDAKLLKSNIKGMSFFTGSLADLDRSVLLKKFTGKNSRLIAEHDRNFSEDMFKLTGNSLVPKFLDKTEMDDNIVCAAYEIDSKDAFDRISNEDLLNYLRTLITVDPMDCSIGMRLEKSERPFHRRLAPAHFNKIYHAVTCEKEFSDLHKFASELDSILVRLDNIPKSFYNPDLNRQSLLKFATGKTICISNHRINVEPIGAGFLNHKGVKQSSLYNEAATLIQSVRSNNALDMSDVELCANFHRLYVHLIKQQFDQMLPAVNKVMQCYDKARI